MTQIAVSVHSQSSGLVTIQNHPKTVLKHLTLMANGVMDIHPNRSFLVTISNFRENPERLPKDTVIGITLPAPVVITEAKMDNLATTTSEEDVESWRGTVATCAEFESDRPQVLDLLREYQAMSSGRLGTIRATQNRIDLQNDARRQFQYPYGTGFKVWEIVADQMDKMRKAQVREPAPPNSSEWPSPLVLVAKKNGSVGFCVDYRKLNAVTKRDSYPIPRMDECLDSLGKAVEFTTLDAKSG
ncbi:unnamed protein product [Agarophyton chilense]